MPKFKFKKLEPEDRAITSLEVIKAKMSDYDRSYISLMATINKEIAYLERAKRARKR